jgi:Zn-dependent protease with chaperone function/Tfp pilus assembly major pilin PilA
VKDELVYPRERSLGAITLVLGLMVWLVIVVGTLGIALLYLAFGFLFYLFAQSALIAWLRGNGVLLSMQQLPDLRERFEACCVKLGIDEKPEAYLLQGNGMLNAFATRFLGRSYVILMSDIVDAMQAHPEGINFYMGHELGHIRMKHLTGKLLRAPVLWLPILGAAYSRAKESTCDRHGRACCESAESAARALVALAAGAQRWRMVDLPAFEAQAQLSRGFWMSYHEITGGYPWLTKRVARILHPEVPMPSRNGFAYFFALFSPYVGPGGGAAGIIVLAAIIGVAAAVGLPAYKDYETRARLTGAYITSEPARRAIADYYALHKSTPPSIDEVGVPATLPDGSQLSLDADSMVLTVETPSGQLVFTPQESADGKVTWHCAGGDGVRPNHLPSLCREEPAVELTK